MLIEKRLAEMGLELGPAPDPVGAYVPLVRTGNLIFVSGTAARIRGVRMHRGKVGREVTIEQGYEAARLTMLNVLSALKAELGDLDRIERVVRMIGYVNSAPDFDQQHLVMNGASDLMVALFGERGHHARAALGIAELPYSNCVEIETVVQVRD